jgi:release factor glutamine methyltransferase
MNLNCTWRDMMREAAQRLAAAGVETAPRDARLLLAHALQIEPVEVIAREMDAIDPVALIQYEAAVQRRLDGEPVSRIRGWREFYGRKFRVTPDVLDPRPETELLVEEGLKRLPPNGRVLDLGTGSGCILVSVLAERGDASGVGVDASAGALKIAGENAAALGVASRARFLEGGWGASIEAELGPFDLILSNPPYIPEADLAALAPDVRRYDPRIALTPGGDGLGAYRAILAPIAKVGGGKLLKSGASIGFEFGLGQEAAVAGMMAAARLRDIVVLPDLAGLARAAFGRRA